MTHLSYALCCELKEAGFPQESHGYWYMVLGTPKYANNAGADVPDVYELSPINTSACPTLEELMEHPDLFMAGMIRWGKKWHASGNGDDGYVGNMEKYHYDTPAEAVARLWLVQNKK